MILPGLGGFVIHHESAKLVANRFFPPRSTVSFNALLTHSDGLLAEALMKSNRIDYRAAITLIEEETRFIKQQLHQGSPLMLGKIGTLQLTNQDKLLFIPATADFLPDNLGLLPITLRPLSVEQSAPRSITIPLPEHGTSVWRYAAVVICIFAFTLFAPQHQEQNSHKAAFTLPIDNTIFTEKKVMEAPEIATIATDTVIATTTAPVTITENVPQPQPLRYHLIVASMPTRQAAEEYCQVNATADAPLRVVSREGKHRIASRSYATHKEAFAALDAYRNGGEKQKKAWILKATI